jgi:hypothetical protein
MSKAISHLRETIHQNSNHFASQMGQIALDQAPQHGENLLNQRAMSSHLCHICISRPRDVDKKCKKL